MYCSLGEKSAIFSEFISGSDYCDWFRNFNFNNDPVNAANVAQYGKRFVEMVWQYSSYYVTPHVLAEWGCDFAFQVCFSMGKIVFPK